MSVISPVSVGDQRLAIVTRYHPSPAAATLHDRTQPLMLKSGLLILQLSITMIRPIEPTPFVGCRGEWLPPACSSCVSGCPRVSALCADREGFSASSGWRRMPP